MNQVEWCCPQEFILGDIALSENSGMAEWGVSLRSIGAMDHDLWR